MQEPKASHRDQFVSKIGFILAATGSAVGLGNIWRFPFLAGKNGGGVFVLFYLVCVVVLGFGLMLAEFIIGRHTQLSSVDAFKELDKRFTFVGVMGVLAAFIIMGYYPVVGGWSVAYVFKIILGEFSTDAVIMGEIFDSLTKGVGSPIFWTAVYMIVNIVIVAKGISTGIENASKVMLPMLFGLLIILVIRSLTLPNAMEGLKYLFVPDFSKISGEVMMAALGQAFFSLSLGMGCMITYASYLGKNENLVENATVVPILDTLVALLAGVVIIPATVSFGFDLGSGPGLVFVTVPAIFATMGPVIGRIFGIIFFSMVTLAALTSSISLLEVVVSYLIDNRNWDRKRAVVITSIILFAICIASSLSMGIWSKYTVKGMNIFSLLDWIANNVLLPLGGIFITLFVGWFWDRDKVKTEVTNNGTVKFSLFNAWIFLCRFVIPIIIALVLLSGIGII
ncbi:sodium-dependent transporter [Tepidimicrobium xylanilyticum]|uniref:Transporter n=1 Tax=Tepidimicrobium xylanilyticum TaxID=1123352 RepID=A0A1H2R7C9_9FIRM|nr:sodium-dependent transporter [Tepidimicrobium xylanilyticum]SDW14754.1 neurotransmitter:Na+ symporter, NSS family [Tepidimicrobium xylanilyticum]